MRDSGLTFDRAELGEVDLRPRQQVEAAAEAGATRSGRRRGEHAPDEGGDVFLEDASLRAGGLDPGEVGTEFAGIGAHRGAGVGLAAERQGGGDSDRGSGQAPGAAGAAAGAGAGAAAGRCNGTATGFDDDDDRAFADLVAQLDLSLP